ncbi:MAG: RluA family pseudouridine synthase [Rhodospirillaceae bacterium]|jgi:23S rRNA pseudouridine955/2504/2580 synthase|nr:RluA family pseudouridine synthase [Rhodospirillaceae bacterium]MBT6285100.1 RluA family pseudouridine synthase [Rhodospirillaceae bacterium]
MSQVETRHVGANESDIRVDRWFRRHFPALKHGRLEKMLRTGQIRVDGGRVKASTRLMEGQAIRIPPMQDTDRAARPAERTEVSAEDAAWIKSLVLYSDDDMIALNKPPGIAVQGGRKVARHIDGLLGALANEGDGRPKLVHRLDRDTSGVLLIARRADVAARLGEIFHSRNAQKTYWALVVGVPRPREGMINAPLAKQADHQGREKMVVDLEEGKSATTDYEVVENAARRAAWLALHPHTGRTHQLRVHCAAIGTPILGDGKYGGSESRLDGVPGSDKLHLHARAITFPQPSGGELTITAPLPKEMRKTWEFLGFDPSMKEFN